MEEISIQSESELESQSFNGKKPSERKPNADDPISLWLLNTYYAINGDKMKGFKIGIVITPFILLFAFAMFISSSPANLIAFCAILVSLAFMVVSLWLLCWILDKDVGSRQM